jgi:hypothetical protein
MSPLLVVDLGRPRPRAWPHLRFDLGRRYLD